MTTAFPAKHTVSPLCSTPSPHPRDPAGCLPPSCVLGGEATGPASPAAGDETWEGGKERGGELGPSSGPTGGKPGTWQGERPAAGRALPGLGAWRGLEAGRPAPRGPSEDRPFSHLTQRLFSRPEPRPPAARSSDSLPPSPSPRPRTCSDGAHHGLHREVEGVVPGADDEHHAQRLRVDVALVLLGLGRLLHVLVHNPLREILDGVVDLLQAIHQLVVVRVPLVLPGEAPVSSQPRALSGLLGSRAL